MLFSCTCPPPARALLYFVLIGVSDLWNCVSSKRSTGPNSHEAQTRPVLSNAILNLTKGQKCCTQYQHFKCGLIKRTIVPIWASARPSSSSDLEMKSDVESTLPCKVLQVQKDKPMPSSQIPIRRATHHSKWLKGCMSQKCSDAKGEDKWHAFKLVFCMKSVWKWSMRTNSRLRWAGGGTFKDVACCKSPLN